MMLLEIGPQARRDLHAVARHLAKQSRDASVARQFVAQLIKRCEDLTAAPGMGAPYAARPGVRKLAYRAYKIFYKMTESKVIILRVWDGRRGHDPLL